MEGQCAVTAAIGAGASFERSLYLEASALERLGDRDEVRMVPGRLLKRWERADADFPLLREARAPVQRVGGAL